MKHTPTKLARIISVATIALTLSACMHPAETAKPSQKLEEALTKMKLQRGEVIEEIPNYKADDWQYIDANNVIVSAGRKDRYLVSFKNRCGDAFSYYRIEFRGGDTRLSKFDQVYAESPGLGNQPCMLDKITRLVDAK